MNNLYPQKTIFLDRDGVINQCAAPHCYIAKWDDFHFMPGAVEGIRILNQLKYLTLIVSNQRGIARKICTLCEVEELHRKMCIELALQGAHIDGIYICPHGENQCECRKPKPGLFYRATKDWLINKDNSYCIGDSETDVQAGHNFGVQTILIGNNEQKYGQELTFGSLLEASIYIQEKERG